MVERFLGPRDGVVIAAVAARAWSDDASDDVGDGVLGFGSALDEVELDAFGAVAAAGE